MFCGFDEVLGPEVGEVQFSSNANAARVRNVLWVRRACRIRVKLLARALRKRNLDGSWMVKDQGLVRFTTRMRTEHELNSTSLSDSNEVGRALGKKWMEVRWLKIKG